MRRLAFIDPEMGDLAAYDDLDRARYETDRAARRNVERISEELGNELAHLARARNVLAHHYLDMKWDLIHRFLGDGRSAVADFVTAIRAYLDTAENSVGNGDSVK